LRDKRVLIAVASLAALLAGASGLARKPAAQGVAVGERENAYRANNLGVARMEQYLYAQAAAHFREALALEPGLGLARVNLALALLYDNQVEEAASEAQRAALALPGSPRAQYVRGLAARLQNRTDDAAAAFERVLEIDPADVGSLVYLGQIRLQARRFDEAIALFRRAVQREPHNATAAYNVAVALTRSGARDEGQRAMQRFQALRDSAYAVTYAQVYLEQGRYGEALASTGAEADLVSAAAPTARFTNVTGEWLAGIGFEPLPRRSSDSSPPDADRLPSAANGALILIDLDEDGDLDLVAADARRLRGFRNGGRGTLVEVTAELGFESTGEAIVTGLVAGDLDNDLATDLVVLTTRGHRMLRRDGARFRDITREASLPPFSTLARTAALVDVDHDGDLDILVAGSAGGAVGPPASAPASAGAQLLRNNGNLRFTDVTVDARIAVVNHAVGIVPTDFDNRRDIDLLVLAENGVAALWNARDGTFSNDSAAFGAPVADDYTALTAADANKDGFVDFFLGRGREPGHLAMSDGQGGLTWSRAPAATAGATAALFVDYDADGLLDLFIARLGPPTLLRNIGSAWRDVTEQALAAVAGPSSAHRALAMGDLDGDGDQDVILRAASGLVALRNDDDRPRRSTAVRLEARVSNRSAAGARIEMRAGSLRQRLDVSLTSPAVAPSDLIFGLGARSRLDVIRVLWPAGILQAELDLPSPAAPTLAGRTLTVTELDRKPSSCPYLFTWNGERFEFITDFLGGGEMGAWMAPGVRNVPDPDEYVRIAGDRLKPRRGRLEMRITNELEEALFLDHVQLLALDHPSSVEIFPDEGLTAPPFKPFTLYTVAGARAPAAALDHRGADVRTQLAASDRRFADGFALLPLRGYAEEHSLTLDVGPRTTRDALLLTGWTDYAFSSDNVAASQSGLRMSLPRLERREPDGTWRVVPERIGFPVGRPQTIVVPLPADGRVFRVVTSMRIYWDRVRVGSLVGASEVRTTVLEPAAADLRWRGFSAEVSPDGREPFGYDYDRVSAASPWKTLPGAYTREGDVLPLIGSVDDMFVVARSGDALAVEFDAQELPALEPGRERTYLLRADGFSKEMDINSSAPDQVGPLPFHGMAGYPYGPGESYPDTPAHREYRDRYNTRRVTRAVAPIDVAAAIEGAASR
jgi:tetratricopeptide (TPR) repeat protein